MFSYLLIGNLKSSLQIFALFFLQNLRPVWNFQFRAILGSKPFFRQITVMFSDWALANLGTIHDEPLFHKKWKFFGLFFFNISCWGDEILKRKSLLKKTPMIKALTRNLHYVFKSLAFIKQQGQRFFEVAFFCLQTSNLFIFWQFYAWGYSIGKDSSADLGVNSKIVQIRPTVKAVSTKISKFFLHICQYFDISERK